MASGREGSAVTRIAAQRLEAEISPQGLRVAPWPPSDAAALDLRVTRLGRGGARQPVAARELVDVRGALASLRRDRGLTEWYRTTPRGLEQGFSLRERPAGAGEPVVVELQVGLGLRPELADDGSVVWLSASDGTVVLHYGALHAYDAAGDELDAQLAVAGQHIELAVDDQLAIYPVIIDPLLWAVEQTLTVGDGEDLIFFGSGLAIDEDTVLVGANGGPKAAYAFVRSASQWSEQPTLTASDASDGDRLGASLALRSDTALVGAPARDESGLHSGAAYVFARSALQWTEQTKLAASDGVDGAGFGQAVALSADSTLIGAPGRDEAGAGSGAAYVFVRDGEQWTEQGKLVPSEGQEGSGFGWAVALDGDTALIGAPRDHDNRMIDAAYVFVRDAGQWTEQQKVVPSQGPALVEGFGTAVALEGDTALIGTAGVYEEGLDQPATGAVFVFARDGEQWTEQPKLVPTDPELAGEFGQAVSLYGDTALVGAPRADWDGAPIGGVYVFGRSAALWTEQQQLHPHHGGGEFGALVSLGNTAALVYAWPAPYVFVYENRKLEGEPCEQGSECASAWCVDGVCCESSCGDGDPNDCRGCSVAVGSALDGECQSLTDTSCVNEEFPDGPRAGICRRGWCNPVASDGCGCPGPLASTRVDRPWSAAGLLWVVVALGWRRRRE